MQSRRPGRGSLNRPGEDRRVTPARSNQTEDATIAQKTAAVPFVTVPLLLLLLLLLFYSLGGMGAVAFGR